MAAKVKFGLFHEKSGSAEKDARPNICFCCRLRENKFDQFIIVIK